MGWYNSDLDIGIIETLVALFLFWPSIAVPVRRLHDLGMSGWWFLWVGLISSALMIGVIVVAALAGVGFESLEMIDDNTPLKDMPILVWIAIAVGAIPILIQYFMLGFMRSEEGENRFDVNSEIGRSHKQDDTPPWTDT